MGIEPSQEIQFGTSYLQHQVNLKLRPVEQDGLIGCYTPTKNLLVTLTSQADGKGTNGWPHTVIPC